ncbi:MAG: hypothetical protein MET45_21030 [Nostoc sp. LLA-1]|nr:hypothetical protein [Cyanocohniella sp. LLY]
MIGISPSRKPLEAKRLQVRRYNTKVLFGILRFAYPQGYIDNDPLPFVYESTGILTYFTDLRDPKPRSKRVFSFHKPETLQEFLKQSKPLRQQFFNIPSLDPEGLRDCQINAIRNLELSFQANHPRALIQMATWKVFLWGIS